jgi:hypothetical protein
VVQSAQRITGGKLPALQDIYNTRCHRKTKKNIKDLSHPSHCLFTPLPSSQQARSVQVHQSWDTLINSFYLKAIRFFKSHQ